MPLPKPPAKRADFLSRADFESQAAHRPPRRASRAEPAGERERPGGHVDGHDPGAGGYRHLHG